MDTRSCSLADILKLIGTWVSIAGAVLIAIGETLDTCNGDSRDERSSSYMIDVRPVDPPCAKR